MTDSPTARVSRLLSHFQDAADSGPFAYPWCHHHAGTGHGHHTVLSCMIHGDEFGTLPAVIELVEALTSGSFVSDGPVTITLGNPEAALYDKRFLDSDLNRAFAFSEDAEGHEHRRALELREIFDQADLMLDLHQTILESPPFWIFPWNPVFGAWARLLQTAQRGITRDPGAFFAATGQLCADEYIRARGKPAFCVELGQKGFSPVQEVNALRTMKTLLTTIDAVEAGHTTLTEAAASQPAIHWYTTVHKEPWGPDSRTLAAGLVNWSPVSAGSDLAAPGSPAIVSPEDGVVLFPKYPDADQPRPSLQFHLARRISSPEESFKS